MPVAALSLNELSRRVRLAKSNVLRYFESREAVLLELLDAAWREWLDAVEAEPAARRRRPGGRAGRARRGGAGPRRSSRRPMLCELASASSAVLERNISAEVAARFKRAALADTERAGPAGPRRPARVERARGAAVRRRGGAGGGLAVGATQPSAAMLAAYEGDCALAAMRLDFGDALHELLATLLTGFLARPAD